MHNKPHTAEAKLKMSLAKKGKHYSVATQFKKGHVPWHKGKEWSDEVRAKMKANHKGFTGHKWSDKQRAAMKETHWVGDAIGYAGLHDWVRSELGAPQECSVCSSTKQVEWANKSHEYKRDKEDWIRLCHLCHMRYDREKGWGKAKEVFKNYKQRLNYYGIFNGNNL